MIYTKAVNRFQKYLAVEKGYSPLTIKEYTIDLQLFQRYLIDNCGFPEDFDVKEISRYEITDFLADSILVEENSPVTRNRKLYSIRSFFKYLQKNEIIKENPALLIEASKTEIRSEPIYMKLNEDGKTVAAMDCLVPGIGEIIGGSQREDDFEKLQARITELGMKPEDYKFYMDLRKYGSTHHAGFGLGFERCVMYLTGMSNIRDVLPYPRTVGNCE